MVKLESLERCSTALGAGKVVSSRTRSSRRIEDQAERPSEMEHAPPPFGSVGFEQSPQLQLGYCRLAIRAWMTRAEKVLLLPLADDIHSAQLVQTFGN